ncbi:MAG: hypothetical protein JSV09_05775 [Thermoplasmata archaeon]|nr:MAG: hypothetical protein JSV09_05775 [Thermoplasmata archaeon]
MKKTLRKKIFNLCHAWSFGKLAQSKVNGRKYNVGTTTIILFYIAPFKANV